MALIEESLICKVLEAPDLEMLNSNGVIEDSLMMRENNGALKLQI